MKKSLLAIALAVASTPFVFAAQTGTPATPPAKDQTTATTSTTKPKKQRVKKARRHKKATGSAVTQQK